MGVLLEPTLTMAAIIRSVRAISQAPALLRRTFVLDAHAQDLDKTIQFNPEWTPGGDEGGVDTNTLPWLPVPQLPGCSLKPLRVSDETGAFTAIIKVDEGVTLPTHVHLGAPDTFIISGEMEYTNGPMKGKIGPATWGYSPAGVKMEGNTATKETEYLATFYGPVAFLDSAGKVDSLLTGGDVRAMAADAGVPLLPNTLAAALAGDGSKYQGAAEPLRITTDEAALAQLSKDLPIVTELANQHFVDTNAIPWIINPDAPDIGLKVMRVSVETGHISLIVRQNGQAPPHNHLGPADFFITSGRIGYRAGPKEGYGPGTYMYEPAGARHEATQRVTDDDLIYTANVWGPICFDRGPGTPPTAVLSWMEYLAAANAFQSPLIASKFPNDSSVMLATN